jgi:hypothetical protein
MSEHPVVACHRGLDSADGVQLGALLADALNVPLVLAAAYRYDPMGLSPGALSAAGNDRRADAAHATLQRARRFVPADVEVRSPRTHSSCCSAPDTPRARRRLASASAGAMPVAGTTSCTDGDVGPHS